MNKLKKMFLVIPTFCMLLAGNAFAALTTEQQAVADSIDTMITDWSTWAWGALLAIVAFGIGAKLAKKFMGKAT